MDIIDLETILRALQFVLFTVGLSLFIRGFARIKVEGAFVLLLGSVLLFISGLIGVTSFLAL